MTFKRIISFFLVAATILTFFVLPASAEEDTLTNISTISSNSIVFNDRITLDAFGYGGVEPYTYAYYYKNTTETTWHTIRGFSEEASESVTLSTIGTYDLCIKIKDANNTIAKKYFVANVTDGPLSSSSYLSPANTFLGETITLNGVGVGGTMPYTYAFYYKKDTESNWHCRQTFQSNNSVNFTPQEVGTYNICIKVHDALNIESKQYFQLPVQNPPISPHFSMSKDNIWLGESIYMSASAEDGNPPYTYAFYAKHSSVNSWTCIQNFSIASYCNFEPDQEGEYQICMKAKDSHNVIGKEYFDLTVHNELSAEGCYISNNKITLGEDITMVGRGKGGTGTYQYAFYYRKQGDSNWLYAQNFGDNNIKAFTPQCADKYDICIKVKDETDTVVEKYFYDVEVEEPGFYVHYYNYNNWQNVKIYYYNDGQGEAAQWPGVNMVDDGNGWYSYKITGYENAKVLFNDGGTNQIPATMVEGFYVDSDMWYRNGVQTDERPDEITVYFYKPSNWSAPNIYYYLNNNDTGPIWPGVAMEEVSDGWYSYHITKYGSAKVIFGDGTYQIPGQNQEGFSVSGTMWYKNGVWCNTTTDTDNDGLLDYQELLLGTNINLSDTDEDTLPDGYEVNMLNTDPLDTDTDDDNISDANEDADNDQLSNYAEYQSQTNPLSEDTDGDGLTDYDELYHLTYTTLSPTNPDTDGDGANDGWEIAHDSNPLIYNQSFNIEDSVTDKNDVVASISFDAEGNQVETFEMKPLESDFILNPSIPGYISSPISLSIEGTVQNPALTFTFDEDLWLDTDFVPAVYYYNENTQMLEEVPGSDINQEHNSITAYLPHFSTYILLNKTEFETIWNRDIRVPTENSSQRHLRVALVIDRSGSMAWDRDDDTNYSPIPGHSKLDVAKDVLENFVDLLQPDDQVTLVSFNDMATYLTNDPNNPEQPIFTTDKTSLYNSINSLNASDGTAIYAGISNASAMFDINEGNAASYDNYDNLMIVITDGKDSPSVTDPTIYPTLIQNANNGIYNNNNELTRGHITIYTVGIGSSVEEDLLTNIATGTHGGYYHASTVNDLEDQIETIQEEMVDYTTDSNNDGISDYYTKKIVNGEITYGTGTDLIFPGATYADIQANDDYDGDGVKNGDEISVETDNNGKIYVKYYSNPILKNTDGDLLWDNEAEVTGTDPLIFDMLTSDLDVLTYDDAYLAANLSMQFDQSLITELQLFSGNFLFNGTVVNKTFYERALLDYIIKNNKLLEAYYFQQSLNKMYYTDNLDLLSDTRNVSSKINDALYIMTEWRKLVPSIQELETMQTYEEILNDLSLMQTKVSNIIDLWYSNFKNANLSAITLDDYNQTINWIQITEEDLQYIGTLYNDANSKLLHCSGLEFLRRETTQKIIQLDQQIQKLQGKLNTWHTGISKFINGIGNIYIAFSYSVHIADAINTYATMDSAINTFSVNTMLLNTIVNQSDSQLMKDAANDLLNYSRDKLGEFVANATSEDDYSVLLFTIGNTEAWPLALAATITKYLTNVSDTDQEAMYSVIYGDVARCLSKTITGNLHDALYSNGNMMSSWYTKIENAYIPYVVMLMQVRIAGENKFIKMMNNNNLNHLFGIYGNYEVAHSLIQNNISNISRMANSYHLVVDSEMFNE